MGVPRSSVSSSTWRPSLGTCLAALAACGNADGGGGLPDSGGAADASPTELVDGAIGTLDATPAADAAPLDQVVLTVIEDATHGAEPVSARWVGVWSYDAKAFEEITGTDGQYVIGGLDLDDRYDLAVRCPGSSMHAIVRARRGELPDPLVRCPRSPASVTVTGTITGLEADRFTRLAFGLNSGGRVGATGPGESQFAIPSGGAYQSHAFTPNLVDMVAWESTASGATVGNARVAVARALGFVPGSTHDVDFSGGHVLASAIPLEVPAGTGGVSVYTILQTVGGVFAVVSFGSGDATVPIYTLPPALRAPTDAYEYFALDFEADGQRREWRGIGRADQVSGAIDLPPAGAIAPDLQATSGGGLRWTPGVEPGDCLAQLIIDGRLHVYATPSRLGETYKIPQDHVASAGGGNLPAGADSLRWRSRRYACDDARRVQRAATTEFRSPVVAPLILGDRLDQPLVVRSVLANGQLN